MFRFLYKWHILLPILISIALIVIFNRNVYLFTDEPQQETFSELPNKLYSSVWCRGSNHTDRLCRFKNLCYEPNIKSFIFLHSIDSVISGVPADRFSPALLDFSSVEDHNALYFNYVDLPHTVLLDFSYEYVEGRALLFKRFNPENLMHVFHDDLLPAYFTLVELGLIKDRILPNDVFFTFADDREPGPYSFLYEKFLSHSPLYLSTVTSEKLTCIQDVYVGLNKFTTWYQYGFKQPQGPLNKNSEMIHTVLAKFREYFIAKFNLLSIAGEHGIVLSRNHNRKILNEDELVRSIEKHTSLKSHVVSLEKYNVIEIIQFVINSKIVIGMHGSLFILVLFLSPLSIVIELFPYAVNPNISTPYKTLSTMLGLQFIYYSWENKDEKNSIPHPEYSAEYGGIKHLTNDIQDKIINNNEVEPHLCCYDPQWLYRIYQDTIVDIDSFTKILLTSLEDIKRFNSTQSQVDSLYPAEVKNIVCALNKNIFNISWAPPWNLNYITANVIDYELWIQEVDTDHIRAFLTKKINFVFPVAGPTNKYYVWIRCVADSRNGPFSSNPLICQIE